MSATLTCLPLHMGPAEIYTENENPFLFRRLRTWWTLLALFLMAEGNGLFTKQDSTYWSLRDLSQKYDSKPYLLLLTALLWIVCALLMVKALRPTMRTALKQKVLLAFGGLACISALWAPDPGSTFRRAALLLLSFAFAWFFASYYSPTDQMRILLAAGIIVGLACIALALLLPEYGIASDGEWKGVFSHKNRMGLGIFYLFSALPFRRSSGLRESVKLGLRAILPLGLILLSQSKTSLIMTVILIAVRIFAPYVASRRRDQLPFVLYSIVVGIPILGLGIMAGKEAILTLLGKDSTISGRTEHWGVLLPYMFRHLWVGYGFGGFWTGTGDSRTVITMVGGAMNGADSGYVDTMLQLGLFGVSMLLIVLLMPLCNFMRFFRRASVPLATYWYAGIILTTLVGSFTEGLMGGGITTFCFAVACAGLRNVSHALVQPAPDIAYKSL